LSEKQVGVRDGVLQPNLSKITCVQENKEL